MVTVEISEAEFTTQVVGTKAHPGVARVCGWRCYHTLRSKGSEPGFPDWVLARERVVYVETKGTRTPVSDPQKSWIRQLLAAGAEAYVVRPDQLDDITLLLSSRITMFQPAQFEHRLAAAYKRLRDHTDEEIR